MPERLAKLSGYAEMFGASTGTSDVKVVAEPGSVSMKGALDHGKEMPKTFATGSQSRAIRQSLDASMGRRAANNTNPNERISNEDAYDAAVRLLLAEVGLAGTRAVLTEVIAQFRERESFNAQLSDARDREYAFAFGPDLLARARQMRRN